jgi:hypothetical protein
MMKRRRRAGESEKIEYDYIIHGAEPFFSHLKFTIAARNTFWDFTAVGGEKFLQFSRQHKQEISAKASRSYAAEEFT